jgi:tetratricopeptide (TPR) repeat protein
VTCHRGVENPRTLDNVLLKTIAKDGAESGEAKYRDLRENYYGSGSYDFTPMTLARVAETLAQENGDLVGARRMIELNLEMNPDHADSYLMLAEVDLAGGNKEAARANIDKALALDPQNGHAQRMLKQLEQ